MPVRDSDELSQEGARVKVRVAGLRVQYPLEDGGQLEALGPLDFTLAAGSFVALLGPSGCGKSTLVRVLAGLLKATQGRALLEGVEPDGSRTGILFQDANLLPWRRVRDNIALPLELAGVTRQARYDAVREVLPVLGLEGFEMAWPAELSGGMARRVAVGRVLLQRPDLLLLDEPFGALDAITREQLGLDLLRLRSRAGQTVLMVTHDINEALLLADRVLVLSPRPGRLVADLAVPLPRPRLLEHTWSQQYVDLLRQLRAALGRGAAERRRDAALEE